MPRRVGLAHVSVGAAKRSRPCAAPSAYGFAAPRANRLRIAVAKSVLLVGRHVSTRCRKRGPDVGYALRVARSELAERDLSTMKIIIPAGTGQTGTILRRDC